jgi:hypothetical protein
MLPTRKVPNPRIPSKVAREIHQKKKNKDAMHKNFFWAETYLTLCFSSSRSIIR